MEIVQLPKPFDMYAVSEFGDVFSSHYESKKMSPATASNGYKRVSLTIAIKKTKTMSIHRLVHMAFVGKIGIGMVVRHKDGDKNNNHYSNLEVGTCQDNSDDMLRHGTSAKGEKNAKAKLTADDVFIIRMSHKARPELARQFGVSLSTIDFVIQKRTWRHI